MIASEFEEVQGISYVIGAVDGSHIPIIAPKIDPASYYCRKGFYSALLQGVVNSKCLFWDYDFGWAVSNHDWSVFQRTEIGKKFLRGKFKPYKLIGDATYPMRPCFILPFKGSKSRLSIEKQYWNFIQSSTRMAVERAFGILKGRWRILLKRIDIPLHHVPDVVTACICLHNLCLSHTDGFDMRWAKQAEEELERTRRGVFGKLHSIGMFHIAET
ncbi:MAG TPA: transposase family protein [Candidatus Nitrosocosmicus sp.]|nr:transposase family protein [Candidatus Nitrosocosmicus sp.]